MTEKRPLDLTAFPSLDEVILPSRAFLLSWRTQNLPVRDAALSDAQEHYRDAAAGDDIGYRDMALLGVIGEAMQPLEDLATLGRAWDRPFQGVARYVSAITYWRHTATNFWQEAPKWSNERIDVFAGFSGTDPMTGENAAIETIEDLSEELTPELLAAIAAAREATAMRLRKLLARLALDWSQFSPYFHAYKHGGLAVSRTDTAAVEDEVEAIGPDTQRHEPSIAVWPRSPKDDGIKGDFSEPDEVVDTAAAAGRMALSLAERFVETRLSVIEAIEFSGDAEPIGLRPMRLPWTMWLREDDLAAEHLQVLGANPTLGWRADEESEEIGATDEPQGGTGVPRGPIDTG